MSIHFHTPGSGDWVDVYKDGDCIYSGLSVSGKQILDALGILYTEEET